MFYFVVNVVVVVIVVVVVVCGCCRVVVVVSAWNVLNTKSVHNYGTAFRSRAVHLPRTPIHVIGPPSTQKSTHSPKALEPGVKETFSR